VRHAVFGKKLSRDINMRKALISNLASAVLENGKITTTLAKAKFARPHVEKLITAAKRKRLSTNRILERSISKKAFSKLIGEISHGFIGRNGGYTRIVKLSQRRGDLAPMARFELLSYQIIKPKVEKAVKTKPIKKTAAKTKKISKGTEK
jgi:large subunit ribosomal protein L17